LIFFRGVQTPIRIEFELNTRLPMINGFLITLYVFFKILYVYLKILHSYYGNET